MLSCLVLWSQLYSDITSAAGIVIYRVMWDLAVQILGHPVSWIFFNTNAVYVFKKKLRF